MNYVVIFAGGTGSRMGSDIPKQFLEVSNKPILIHTIEKFSNSSEVDAIVVVSKDDYVDYAKNLIKEFNISKVLDVISGGETGQESIYNGIKYLIENTPHTKEDLVLIHDGVRPVINNELIHNSISCAKENGNSIAVSKAIETVLTIDDEGKVQKTIDRSKCRNAKAPQIFHLNDIWEYHTKAKEQGIKNVIDSATLASLFGKKLYTTECRPENIKITTPNDYYMFKAMYESNGLK